MNPLILLGLGAMALMAMGKKKTAPPIEEESEPVKQGLVATKIEPRNARFVATKIDTKAKQAFAIKSPPINHRATINSQAGTAQAKQCHLQGMNNVDQITGCIANKLFPGWNWNERTGWQNDAWWRMKNLARTELGMEPILGGGN